MNTFCGFTIPVIMLIFIAVEEGKIGHSGVAVQSCLLFGYGN